jgi:hypothetical protein
MVTSKKGRKINFRPFFDAKISFRCKMLCSTNEDYTKNNHSFAQSQFTKYYTAKLSPQPQVRVALGFLN